MKHPRISRSCSGGAISIVFLLALVFICPARGQNVTNVSVGGNHVLFLESDGSLWGMGEDFVGALGNGSYDYTNLPEQLISGGVTAIAAGGDRLDSGHPEFSLFIKTDGSLWSMGNNESGQLGDGTTTNTNRPEEIVSANVVAVACGEWHSLFLKSDGSLWAMGLNGVGQLGDGSTTEAHSPEEIVSSNVIAIAAGDSHSMFLKTDGSVWTMGWNSFGQLGNGTTADSHSPVQIASNAVAISAKYEDSFFIKSDGSLWGTGWNRFGQLGDGTQTDAHAPKQIVSSNVVAVAGGDLHCLFIKSDGSLWGMGGINDSGELGDGTTAGTNRPEQIVSSNVAGIAAGDGDSYFVKSDGSLWAMGANNFGDLGDGTGTDQHWPVQIVPFPPGPTILGMSISGNDLIFNGLNGVAGGTYYTLMSTNLSVSRSNWVPVATNESITAGAFTFTATNAFNPNASQQFYILQLLR
jgi:alpha-tubulin suppressor-like RCC1 family protein